MTMTASTEVFRQAMTLVEACNHTGVEYKEVPLDGKWYTTPVTGKGGKNAAGRIKLFSDGQGGTVHNWVTGDKITFWYNTPAKQTTAQREERAARIAAEKQKEEVRKAKCRAIAPKILKAATDADPNHPYLLKKQVKPHGIKQSGDRLLIPVKKGKILTGLQVIYPDGSKKFLTGTEKQGAYFPINGSKGTVYLCEGYATGATIHEATGATVLTCFDCGNLKPVALEARKIAPHAVFVIAADNDRGNPENPGLTKATAAAEAIGAKLAAPIFPGDHGTDFNDLASAMGLDEVRWQLAAAEHVTPTPPAATEPPEPGPAAQLSRFRVQPFPFKILDEPFAGLISRYAEALQVQPEVMAMSFLTVTSGAIGNAVVVQAKRGWETPPFIWWVLIALSGGGKTHSIEAAMKPTKELQAREATRHKRLMDTYNKELAEYKANKRDRQPPTEPEPMKHYYSQNFTIEALIPMYQAEPRGLTIHVDELAGMFKGFNQYKSGGNDAEQILSLFNAGDLKSDRKGGCNYARNSGAAVLGGLQPGIVSEVFGDSDYENGLVYRLLPMIVTAPPAKFTTACISEDDEKLWSRFLEWVYSIPINTDPASGKIQPLKLQFTPDALEEWRKFYDGYATAQTTAPAKFRGYLPKLQTYCLKFATVLHVMCSWWHDGPFETDTDISPTISASTMTDAITLTEYFAGQALQLIRDVSGGADIPRDEIKTALEQLKGEVSGGKLNLARVREVLNEQLPENRKISETGNKKLANWLRGMGYTVTTGTNNKSFLILHE